MTAEEYVEKSISSEGAIQILVRELTGAGNMPEFSSEEITVQDAAALIGIPEASIRSGILWGWLPIGKAISQNREITGKEFQKIKNERGEIRVRYYIFPRAIWEQTGYVWRGKEALKSVHT